MKADSLCDEKRQDAETNLRRFLKILHVELEYLCAHIDLLVESYHEKERRREVTERVCNENVATLQNEECGCCQFIRVVERLKAADYDSLASLVADVRERFKSAIEYSGVAPATYLLVTERIDEVERYVRNSVWRVPPERKPVLSGSRRVFGATGYPERRPSAKGD